MTFIINLHNDLLSCVESNPSLSFSSSSIRCSLPQIQKAHIQIEVLALFALTNPNSTQKAQRQLELYQKLLKVHEEEVSSIQNYYPASTKTHFLLALENASTLLLESEPLKVVFDRLENLLAIEKLLYIGLTWNQENRFGGGNLSQVGLKPDGIELIRFLQGKKIAIDLSHTSDPLAYDIINLIDREGLDVPLLASHSNYRSICLNPRNLPDELVKEAIRKKGLIGFNFVKHFIGDRPEDSFKHLEHALKLGAEDQIAFGADFFGALDVPSTLLATPEKEAYFFDQYPDSSFLPLFIQEMEKHFPHDIIQKMAFENAMAYLTKNDVLSFS